jgi:uncharacterized protein (TIGR02266 family)
VALKNILIAHRLASVRDRFAVALADLHHEFALMLADSEEAATRSMATATEPVVLAIVDVGLSADPVGFLRALARATAAPPRIMVFSSSIPSAAEIPLLASMTTGYVNEFAATPQILPAISPHLFPDRFRRRAVTRLALGVPVTYRSGETVAGAVTLDVGKGGLAIRTVNPLPKGTTVRVRFRLPGTSGEIDAAGRVAWSDGRMGMGVQFERLSSTHQRTINGFVDTHLA